MQSDFQVPLLFCQKSLKSFFYFVDKVNFDKFVFVLPNTGCWRQRLAPLKGCGAFFRELGNNRKSWLTCRCAKALPLGRPLHQSAIKANGTKSAIACIS